MNLSSCETKRTRYEKKAVGRCVNVGGWESELSHRHHYGEILLLLTRPPVPMCSSCDSADLFLGTKTATSRHDTTVVTVYLQWMVGRERQTGRPIHMILLLISSHLTQLISPPLLCSAPLLLGETLLHHAGCADYIIIPYTTTTTGPCRPPPPPPGM